MSILDRIQKKPKEKQVLVQCYLSPELHQKVVERIKKLEVKVSISSLIRAGFEEFIGEDSRSKKVSKQHN